MPPVVVARPGRTNSLHDVSGLRVGHVDRCGDGWLTGVSVVCAPEEGAVCGVDVRGGGPGTRETDLLDPRNMVERVHAVALCGGSAYGLSAADGVMRGLYQAGIGFPVGEGSQPGQVVPIVPAAVVFDLGRGGRFDAWPDPNMGRAALEAARAADPHTPVPLGGVGAGAGAVAGGLAGGVGSASGVLASGHTVAALVVVNSFGSCVHESTGVLHAEPFCHSGDLPAMRRPDPEQVASARQAAGRRWAQAALKHTLATTIAVVGTDATLTKAQCAKVAGVAHDGMARAIRPVHTMVDGDTVFTLATGTQSAPDPLAMHALFEAAGDCLTRAIARAVLAANGMRTPAGAWRSYREAFSSAFIE